MSVKACNIQIKLAGNRLAAAGKIHPGQVLWVRAQETVKNNKVVTVGKVSVTGKKTSNRTAPVSNVLSDAFLAATKQVTLKVTRPGCAKTVVVKKS